MRSDIKYWLNSMEFHCPRCGEALNYYAPDSIGVCECCHYNTEEGETYHD